MQLSPHLTFNGQCEDAFRFYENSLGGKIIMKMTWGEAPGAEQTNPDWRDKIMHATLALGNNRLAGADVPPDRYEKPQGFYVIVDIADAGKRNGSSRLSRRTARCKCPSRKPSGRCVTE